MPCLTYDDFAARAAAVNAECCDEPSKSREGGYPMTHVQPGLCSGAAVDLRGIRDGLSLTKRPAEILRHKPRRHRRDVCPPTPHPPPPPPPPFTASCRPTAWLWRVRAVPAAPAMAATSQTLAALTRARRS
jgi:hypothetical protein